MTTPQQVISEISVIELTSFIELTSYSDPAGDILISVSPDKLRACMRITRGAGDKSPSFKKVIDLLSSKGVNTGIHESIIEQTLATLNEIYNDYLPQSSKEPLAVLFVNLIADATIESSKDYIDQFNKNFNVLSLSKKEMSKAKNIFGLTFSDVQEDGQLFHKGYTYLLKRTNEGWRIKYVYVQGDPERDQVYSDILALTNIYQSD